MTNKRLGNGMKFKSYGKSRDGANTCTHVLTAISLNLSTGLNNSDVNHSL